MRVYSALVFEPSGSLLEKVMDRMEGKLPIPMSIDWRDRQEALEWTKRFPNPGSVDGEIEVRQMFELEDFGPSEAIERFRELGVATEK